MNTHDLPHQQVYAEWANRILILSLLGIAYLTLFPFRMDLSPTLIFHRSPFLLGPAAKQIHYLDFDFFLNVLLFVPFGFGIAAQAAKRGRSRWTAFFLALVLGMCTSYLVELLQFYIPERDSGWEDVFTNTTGSVVGFVLFAVWGNTFLREMSEWEDGFEAWFSPARCALLLAAYFALWFGVSARLQKDTRLSNWDAQSILTVGNDAAGQNPWNGRVLRLQIWDRALSNQAAERIGRQESASDAGAGWLASYDFGGEPPYQDQKHFLPALEWVPEPSHLTNAAAPGWNGGSWLSTRSPVENLMRAIMKSSQFTVHVVCVPADNENVNGRIVAFSRSAGNVNFLLRQEGQFLVFRLREPLSTRRALLGLAWYVPGVFQPGKARDIVASYDGSEAFIYLDGNRVGQDYRLSPGASLAHRIRPIEPESLDGYIAVYETLMFLPAGLLLGVAVRRWPRLQASGRWTVVLCWILPAVLLEIFLALVSGRRIWPEDVALSVMFGLAGALLANADRHFKKSAAAI